MLTAFAWPIRCARSSAWSSSPGTQRSSPKHTLQALVSVIPWPAAVIERRKRTGEPRGAASKARTSDCRSLEGVVPSMRKQRTPLPAAARSAASSTVMWCAKKRSRSHEATSSSAYSAVSAAFAAANSTTDLESRLRRSNDGPLGSASASRVMASSASVACGGSETSTRCLCFGGSSSRTSALSRRTISVSQSSAYSSASFDEPLTSSPRRPPKKVGFAAQ
mmetsp:Transcript_4357/g.14114  ORF Transcript_4357/g.14114 Transcript_4357/m.14114 type:complete len:221 (+) Transcript_4357:135-797(+)